MLLCACCLQDEIVSNHDELMCNFFAQADALAYGKSREELRSQNVPDYLIPHRWGRLLWQSGSQWFRSSRMYLL
jgi:hypothetical protein